MNLKSLSDSIKAEAKRLGFFAVGIAKAEPVSETYAQQYRESMERGDLADMGYLYEHIDMRLDPRLLMPGVKSIVSVALNYTPAMNLPKDSYHIAAYALGKDYHDVVKHKLWQLAEGIGLSEGFRCFVDTAPVLERYWAQQAGMGWIGHNQQLIIPNAGSMFFLGELFLAFELDYDTPMSSQCGACHRCIDACPTHALSMETTDGNHDVSKEQACRFDARKCLSYQTIENRGDLAECAQQKIGNRIYGCDNCQQACPYNRQAPATTIPEFMPSQQLLDMKRTDWNNLTVQDYRALFKGSAVKRAKFDGLRRNIDAVIAYYKRHP